MSPPSKQPANLDAIALARATADAGSAVRRGTHDALVIVNRQSESVTVARSDSRIARAVEWLLQNQRPSGAWGIENVACTSLVLLAFASLRRQTEGWDLEAAVVNSLERGSDFVTAQFQQEAFEHAMWDTAVAIRALVAAGSEHRAFIGERVAWLRAQTPAALNAGPHHLAQRTLAFVEAGAPRDVVREAAEGTAERLETGGLETWSPYVLAQCLDAIRTAGIDYDLEPLTVRLVDFLQRTDLDSANFVNICCALDALHPAFTAELEGSLRHSVASLFGETAFRADGTWYHDELCTAWALLALTRFSTEVVIRVPKSDLMYQLARRFEEMTTDVDRELRNDFWSWSTYLAVAFVVGSMAAFFVTYTTVESDLPGWLQDWVLPVTLGALFLAIAQHLVRRYRRVHSSLGGHRDQR